MKLIYIKISLKSRKKVENLSRKRERRRWRDECKMSRGCVQYDCKEKGIEWKNLVKKG